MSDGIEKLRPINPGESIKITDNNQKHRKEQRHKPGGHREFDRLLHSKEEEMLRKETPKKPGKARYRNGKRII